MRIRLGRCLINLFGLAVVNFLSLVAPALGADAIKFALPGNSMDYPPLFVVVYKGFFKDEGLETSSYRD